MCSACVQNRCFFTNFNISRRVCGRCLWAQGPLINSFYYILLIKGTHAHKHWPQNLLEICILKFVEKQCLTYMIHMYVLVPTTYSSLPKWHPGWLLIFGYSRQEALFGSHHLLNFPNFIKILGFYLVKNAYYVQDTYSFLGSVSARMLIRTYWQLDSEQYIEITKYYHDHLQPEA